MSVNVDLTATDSGASSTIESVKGSVDDLSGSSISAGDAVGGFTSSLSAASRVGDTALLAVDRMQISQDGLTNAQIRQELAQTRLTDAVSKYGAGSAQAIAAQQEFTVATDNVTTAHTRMEERMISTALVTIPRMISGIQNLGKVFAENMVSAEGETVSIEALTSAQLANIAVATLGVGVPIALAALALAQSANVGGSTTNLYGNVSINGADTSNVAASTSQFAMSARP